MFVACVVGKLLYSSSTWQAIVAQYRLQEESNVKAIVNNTAADSHIFLLRQSLPCVYYVCTSKQVFKNFEQFDWFWIKLVL